MLCPISMDVRLQSSVPSSRPSNPTKGSLWYVSSCRFPRSRKMRKFLAVKAAATDPNPARTLLPAITVQKHTNGPVFHMLYAFLPSSDFMWGGFAIGDLPEELKDGILIVGAGIAGLATAKALQMVFFVTCHEFGSNLTSIIVTVGLLCLLSSFRHWSCWPNQRKRVVQSMVGFQGHKELTFDTGVVAPNK
jgi:hypothetical protein